MALNYMTRLMLMLIIVFITIGMYFYDTATIVNELEIQHPAAKLLVLAGKAQQEEIGDVANLVVSIAGQHLEGAEELIRMGLHPSEIIIGYTKSSNKNLADHLTKGLARDLVHKSAIGM